MVRQGLVRRAVQLVQPGQQVHLGAHRVHSQPAGHQYETPRLSAASAELVAHGLSAIAAATAEGEPTTAEGHLHHSDSRAADTIVRGDCRAVLWWPLVWGAGVLLHLGRLIRVQGLRVTRRPAHQGLQGLR